MQEHAAHGDGGGPTWAAMPTTRSTACLPPVPTSRCHSAVHQPDKLGEVALLWDGEWKITYETFRDMGLPAGVG